MNIRKFFSAIVMVLGLMSVAHNSYAIVTTKDQYRNLILQNQFTSEYPHDISYAEKAEIFERLRNAYTMSSETAIREAFVEISNGNVCLRAELDYILRISEHRNELLLNLNYISEAYYSLTNDVRPVDDAIRRPIMELFGR